MGARRSTDQEFRDAVADPEVRTIADLCRRLGIVPRGGNYDTVRRQADRLGLTPLAPRPRRATDRGRNIRRIACAADTAVVPPG